MSVNNTNVDSCRRGWAGSSAGVWDGYPISCVLCANRQWEEWGGKWRLRHTRRACHARLSLRFLPQFCTSQKSEHWTHIPTARVNFEKFHAQSAKLKEETSFFYFVCLLPTSFRACNRFSFFFALQFQWLRHIHTMPYALARRASWLSTLSTTPRSTHPSEEYQIPSPSPPPLSFGACCGIVQKYNKTRNL